MGVFLRWGVFGILAVAAMVYAYNASKRLAEHQQSKPPVVSQRADARADSTEGGVADTTEAEEPGGDEVAEPEMPAACAEEQQVAERALKMRRDGEPLDRLLRNQVIAFQSDAARRERLESVARKWFEREGRDPDGAALRREVLRDCQNFKPAP